MACLSWMEARGPLRQIRPGARLALGLAGGLAWAGSPGPGVAAAGLLAGLAAAVVAGLPARPLLRRLTAAWFVLGSAAVGLWLTAAGGFRPTGEGAWLGGRLLLRGSAVVLWVTVWVGTLDAVELGRVLAAWRVPSRMVLLLLGTVRFAEMLHVEYRRRSRAMRARGFRLRTNAGCVRVLAELAGLLVVRGFERSERVLAAMRCRGFAGRIRSWPAEQGGRA